MTDEERDFQQVDRALATLTEFFETAQVFVTRHTASGTVNVNKGLGNWFARRGQVAEWLVKENENSRASIKENDNDG